MSATAIVLLVITVLAGIGIFACVENIIDKDEALDCKIMSCDHSDLDWEIVYW